jgi:hypothetical protein
MLRSILIGTCLGIGVILLRIWVFSPQEVASQPVAPSPTRELPQIAGLPYEEAQAIVRRHQEGLMKVPGVYIVEAGGKGILVGVFVHTNAQGEKPTTLPPAIQALPSAIEGLPLEIKPLYVLPPPPGVIVLKPGGIREQADECPRGFREIIQFGWHFCVTPGAPESIPTAMMEPPIAGIPFEEALKILERHRDELLQLPGVTAVGMGSEGITIETTNPSVVPSDVEGVPVKVRPPRGQAVGANHTLNAPATRLHGGVAIRSPGFWATLNGIALSEGKPYLIFATHILTQCGSASPCALASSGQPPLNSCNHTPSQPPSENIQQSPFTSPTLVGRTVRWDRLVQLTTTSTDVAAAFMDNDSTEGNASLIADRRQEMWTEIMGRDFTGIDRDPFREEIVRVVTAHLPHVFPALVLDINQTKDIVMFCLGSGGPFVFLTSCWREIQLGPTG